MCELCPEIHADDVRDTCNRCRLRQGPGRMLPGAASNSHLSHTRRDCHICCFLAGCNIANWFIQSRGS
ncbi:hypothetical protein GWI33_022908 [Rhynchophorus ferrugineus]|uniref:Uncharacterized protein n=1 Tax=Rhynchophorus ferrugineus TaxID=354439 RepID=A0A834IMX7_RHYFE|nr:hypothetical protein GWI33_022908 [Rhynchophorus ferrugineus]